ncbi:Protein-tyrosine sulfotransferase [Paragonimus heterotremus]|uniref:Protein-tyrosine sulfotransferase n=1 Tax=Paragonimus heterotremus TaxID=100268 RepID=A0A8J4TMP9_9TREM|nr:Protein-tyrosine sulfotransferase [Paragonimus heterotremus]
MIRCGPETHILPKLMEHFRTAQVGYVRKRLDAANLSTEDVNHAFATFIRYIIEKAGSPAPILCNKDPLLLAYLMHLHEMFPTAKFLHIVRDGRAVTASMIKKKIRMGKLGREKNWDAFAHFKRWEKIVDGIEQQCRALKQCHTIHYEDLVLKPRQTMQDVLSFLNVPWDPVVLHHENFVNKTVFVSSMEPSTSQVVNPLYVDALSSWVSDNSTLPQDFIYNVHKQSTVLRNLGYDKVGIPPVYGQAELATENRTRGQYIIENFH